MAEKSKSSTTKDKVHKCKVCHIKCPDIESYVEHLESKDHNKELMKEKYGAKYLEAKAKLDNTPSISTKFPDEKPIRPKDQSDQEQDSSNEDSSEEEVEVYTCELCRKICTGFISYQMHLNGKKHQKAVYKAKLLRKMKENDLMPKSSKENPPKEQSLLDMILGKAEYEYASQDIECEICQKKCSGPESYRQHCKSSAHQKKVAYKDLINEMITSGEGQQLTDGEGLQFSRCEVCHKNFSGLAPYQQHMAGTQHQKQAKHAEELSKIKDLIINAEDASKRFQCKECGKSFSGPVPFNDHLQSNVHAKLKKKSSQMKSLMENYPEFVKVPASIQDSEDSDNDSGPESFMLACDICHLVFSGPEAARDHVESSKHKKTIKKKALFKKSMKKKSAMKGTEASDAQKKLKKVIKETKIDSSSDSDSEFDIIPA
ncbi:hypothetical protein JTE90_018271 [Oedothorax gibbosus]|uniref:Uncharacterized protein n=1 Tax=Oedothorax gibbosus TaxID=931172 RepID=A0AAV6UWK9_9ARAC|nr:hypothetical protein JTE90_018271 [Oedothorax gibbosus]